MIPFALPLYKNKYNILEPKTKLFYPVKIDTAIVPVLGIDSSFKRIGFGKGMYDRFFSSLNYRPKVIFLSPKTIVSRYCISDWYDVCGDEFISNFCVLERGINDRIYGNRIYNIWHDSRR